MRVRPRDRDGHSLIYLAEIESARAGGVGVAIPTDCWRLSRSVEFLENFRAPPPIVDAGTLEVRDDYRAVGVVPYAKRFIDRRNYRIGFAAQVRRVYSLGFREQSSESFHFLCRS